MIYLIYLIYVSTDRCRHCSNSLRFATGTTSRASSRAGQTPRSRATGSGLSATHEASMLSTGTMTSRTPACGTRRRERRAGQQRRTATPSWRATTVAYLGSTSLTAPGSTAINAPDHWRSLTITIATASLSSARLVDSPKFDAARLVARLRNERARGSVSQGYKQVVIPPPRPTTRRSNAV